MMQAAHDADSTVDDRHSFDMHLTSSCVIVVVELTYHTKTRSTSNTSIASTILTRTEQPPTQ